MIKIREVVAEVGWSTAWKEPQGTFGGHENVPYLNLGDGYWKYTGVYVFVKIHQVVHLRFVHCIVYKLYFNKVLLGKRKLCDHNLKDSQEK